MKVAPGEGRRLQTGIFFSVPKQETDTSFPGACRRIVHWP